MICRAVTFISLNKKKGGRGGKINFVICSSTQKGKRTKRKMTVCPIPSTSSDRERKRKAISRPSLRHSETGGTYQRGGSNAYFRMKFNVTEEEKRSAVLG